MFLTILNADSNHRKPLPQPRLVTIRNRIAAIFSSSRAELLLETKLNPRNANISAGKKQVEEGKRKGSLGCGCSRSHASRTPKQRDHA